MRSDLKVMTVLGTRPEIIRLSAVIKRLDQVATHVLVHTGQNYDYELNEVFFEELGVRRPDHFLGIDASTLGRALGNILIEIERVIVEERPDAFLVLGDTNSALSAIMAKRLRVPIFHMEAGNRSFDANVPEEINRRIVDHIADVNMVYTEHARRHLLSEGLRHRQVLLTGSPMREVLDGARDRISASSVLEELGLTADGFLLASVHREENVDAPDRLRIVLECLESVADEQGVPVIVSTHPRTRNRLADLGGATSERLRFCDPFGYFDYNRLQMAARCVISDSGSVSEESAILGFPAVTIRDSMERPEALDTSTVVLTGLDPARVADAVRLQVTRAKGGFPQVPREYTVDDVSDRVAAAVIGLSGLVPTWIGMRRR
jgi:UDP-N-acetyl-L-fucosamine synthase